MSASLVLRCAGLFCWLILELLPWHWLTLDILLLTVITLWAATEVTVLGLEIGKAMNLVGSDRCGNSLNQEEGDELI